MPGADFPVGVTLQDPASLAAQALTDYASEPGRSALIRITADGITWEGGASPDVVRPAASLLKLAVALAAEDAIADGSLDVSRRVAIADLSVAPDDRSVLDLLDSARGLSVGEVLALMLGASDNPCARWLVGVLGLARITSCVTNLKCSATTVEADESAGVGGTTTCRDALTLLASASDPVRYPLSAGALRHSIRNSRIPLGATDDDIRIAHKTGTLLGLAHDVAVLECAEGQAEIAFLTEEQHDTLITGYAMGLCTRTVLESWGLSVRSTTSVAGA